MKTILAPIDFSAATDAVVAHATKLARAFQARLVLLSVVQPPLIISDYTPLLENMVAVVASAEKTTRKRLAKLQTQLANDFHDVEIELLTGAPIPAIVDTAKKYDADCIVMGSHGHTALYDLLVGSTTHGVLMRATCPVVVVPAEKSRATKRSARR